MVIVDCSYPECTFNTSDVADVLFNKEPELVIRLQDKGHRFVFVDKETDKIKAQQQIANSSFEERNYDLTKEHIKKVEQRSEK